MPQVAGRLRQPRAVDPTRIHLAGKVSDTGSLAALAALTMQRQAPGLLLPANLTVPSSFSFVREDDKALPLARSLVELGIGSVAAWNKHGGNCSLFVRSALSEWLQELGADTLRNNVDLNLAIVDDVDNLEAAPGKLFILVETEDGCGSLEVGKALDALEKEEAGLGRAFYETLVHAICRWMYVYDVEDARNYVEHWKESIEMDMEPQDGTATEESFLDYCDAHHIAFPDVERGIPECVRAGRPSSPSNPASSLALLRRHRNGPRAEWIAAVLEIAAIRFHPRPSIEEDLGLWDADPCPNWLLSFYRNDPVSFAFDEEAQTWNEYSHAPTWIERFDPANVAEVKSVLSHVRNLLRINLLLVQLSEALKRSFAHGNACQDRLDDELRAA